MVNVLLLFGFLWMVVAAIIGFLLAKRHEMALVDLERIAATGNLAEYHRVNDIYKWNKTVHAHTFLFSVVTVTVGLVMERMNYSESTSNGLAITLMLSSIVWTLGGLLSNRALMVIGDITLLASIVMVAVGLSKVL